MTQEATLDPGRTAVVIMDFQVGIVGPYASDPESVVERAASVLAAARGAGVPVFHVIHRGGQFEADSPDVEIHPASPRSRVSRSSVRCAPARSRQPASTRSCARMAVTPSC